MRWIPAAGVDSPQSSRPRAFTLVELLVVIGIIALLVSILLPALNHARQQANLLVCQTHLRQIGYGIDLYTQDNKGTLPFGYWSGVWSANPSAFNAASAADFSTLVTNELNSRLGNTYGQQGTTGGYQPFNRGIFLDVDAIQGNSGLHYSCNPRLMPNLNTSLADGTSYHGCVPYKIAHIQRSSEIVLVMDGVQIKYNANATNGQPDENYWGANATAYAIDDWKFLGAGHEFPVDYLLFNDATDNGISIDPGPNIDDGSGTTESGAELPDGEIRWRHMNNRAANFLYVDGHVEAHFIKPNPGGATKTPPQYYTTDLLGKNINVNP